MHCISARMQTAIHTCFEYSISVVTFLKGNLAHYFMIFHLVFVCCPMIVVKTLITENNENIGIVYIYGEKKI